MSKISDSPDGSPEAEKHTSAGLITPQTMADHKATWWVYAGPEKIRHTRHMRGTWGYDVTCSCGRFETRTGGGTRAYVAGQLWDHRYDEQFERAS